MSSRAQQAISLLLIVTFATAAGAVLRSRSESFRSTGRDAVAIAHIAGGRTVLAPDPIAETLAVSGVRVWLSNPIDAFSRQDQSAYLDFLDGKEPSAERALSAVAVVVVLPGSPAAELTAENGFTSAGRVGAYEVMQRG